MKILRSILRAAILFAVGMLLAGRPGFSQLKWPSISEVTKPWTRWWWMGSAVNERDLKANMERYSAAGLGGLELTPIYGVKGYEGQFIPYLSPHWVDMLGFTLKEADQLGLGIDMATGTGWPFGGGPLIDSTFACKDFVYKTWSLRGGEALKDTVQYIQEPLVRSDGGVRLDIGDLVQPVYANKDLQRLALFQVRWRRPLPLEALMAYSADGKVLDLTAMVDGAGRLRWTAPAGAWTLYGIFRGWHGKMVERAAPGGEGNVIDHFSGAALQRYLSRFDTAFQGRDLHGLRAFFNDSYEVDDARGQSNWTPGFFEIFRERRGYDLREHLPELLGRGGGPVGGEPGGHAGSVAGEPGGHAGPFAGAPGGLGQPGEQNRVLCDYRETISELLLDKFTRGWGDWAHRKGAIIRNQAHGSPANILDLYAASDIPETEGSDILRYKFASSAAHVMGKRLVSSESLTWLNEHFLSTLSDEKKALDNYLLGGVNHIFYHGTAYSPAEDPWPGWLFYASVHFTPNDPSWRNFSTLNEYVARCQSFLQKGVQEDDVLLYFPMYDSWSERGTDLLKHYDRMEPEFKGTGFEHCADVMQEKGYAFDYISDKQLQGAKAGDGGIQTGGDKENQTGGDKGNQTGGGVYKTVVLPDCRLISTEAFEKLVELAEAGATIIVYKRLPSDVPGLDSVRRRRGEFISLLDKIKGAMVPIGDEWVGMVKAAEGKGAFVMGDDLGRLLAYAHIRQERMVEDSLSFVRRRTDDGYYYFLVNNGSGKWAGYLPLSVEFGGAAIFNPMNGVCGAAKWKLGPDGKAVYVELRPGESCVVQTFAGAVKGTAYPYYRPAGALAPVLGDWRLEWMEGGPFVPEARTVKGPRSWTGLGEQEASFSGTVRYSIRMRRPAMPAGVKPAAWLLDLGKVNESAQVFVNGKKIASLIGPYFQAVIPDSNMRKENLLEVQVSNLMVNRIEYMDRAGIPYKKFYNYNFPPHLRENRGADGLFDASKWAPKESGLSGPVTLTLLKRLL